MDGRLFRALFFILLLPDLANADAVNSEWYSTTRALSMGNVGIASADDPSTAAFYNPAALAQLKKPVVEIFNPQLQAGGGVFTLSNSLTDWGNHASFSKVEPLLKAEPGTASSLGYALFPNLSSQNFSFGVLLSNQTASYYDERVDAYYHRSRQLFIPSLGISAALLGGRFRIGVAGRAVQLSSRNVVSQGTNPKVSALDDSRSGMGIGLDSGVLLTLPWGGLPTLGFVARNIGDTAFPLAPMVALGGTSAARPHRAKMTYDAGFSLSPKGGKGNQMTVAFDYRDILDTTKTDMLRKFNAGLEFGLSKIFYMRLGFSQGYFTAGFGLNSPKGGLDLGTYGEELDARGFHGFLDRRYSIRFIRRF